MVSFLFLNKVEIEGANRVEGKSLQRKISPINKGKYFSDKVFQEKSKFSSRFFSSPFYFAKKVMPKRKSFEFLNICFPYILC